MTAWGVDRLEPDRLPAHVLLVGLMVATLLMSVAIGDAFDGGAWLFVTGYLLLQIGRSAFLVVALRGRALGEHFVNVVLFQRNEGIGARAAETADRRGCGVERRARRGRDRRHRPRERSHPEHFCVAPST
jgi:Bacterial low temperature requirement A protein (LtrA)